jgi:hypothetical protein
VVAGQVLLLQAEVQQEVVRLLFLGLSQQRAAAGLNLKVLVFLLRQEVLVVVGHFQMLVLALELLGKAPLAERVAQAVHLMVAVVAVGQVLLGEAVLVRRVVMAGQVHHLQLMDLQLITLAGVVAVQ